MSITRAVECLSRGDMACFSASLASTVDSFLKDPISAFTSAVDAISTGASMIMDDIMDFGKVDRVHHWLVGLVLLIAGVIALVVAIVILLTKPF
jgi:hypothetical protein